MHYPSKHMPDVLLGSHILCKQQHLYHLKLRYINFSLASITVIFGWEELKSRQLLYFFKNHNISATFIVFK